MSEAGQLGRAQPESPIPAPKGTTSILYLQIAAVTVQDTSPTMLHPSVSKRNGTLDIRVHTFPSVQMLTLTMELKTTLCVGTGSHT